MPRHAIRASIKREVLKTHCDVCALCGGNGPLELDHKLPVALGGTNDAENLWPLCKKCHRRKTSGHTIAEKLSSDLFGICKSRRLAKKWGAPRPKGSIKSRGFCKTLRKKMDGTVQRKDKWLAK